MSDEDTVRQVVQPMAPDVPVVSAPPVPVPPTVAEIGEYEDKKANRQLRHWVIKVIVIVVAVAFSLLVAGLIWKNVVKAPAGQADTTMLKQFLDTLLEMLKLMKN